MPPIHKLRLIVAVNEADDVIVVAAVAVAAVVIVWPVLYDAKDVKAGVLNAVVVVVVVVLFVATDEVV